MIEEKKLIKKLRSLNRIKPDKKWVFLTKKKILNGGLIEFFPFFQPVYAGVFLILIFIGLFGVSQKSLPGEPLYYIKKISEETQKVFLSETEKPKTNLELTNKKLEELKKVAEKNDLKKLLPAINEVKVVSNEAAKSLIKVKEPNNEIVEKTKNYIQNKALAQKFLGIELDTALDETYKVLAEEEITKLENSSLTEEQIKILEEAKDLLKKQEYANAFLKVIELTQTR